MIFQINFCASQLEIDNIFSSLLAGQSKAAVTPYAEGSILLCFVLIIYSSGRKFRVY